MVVREHLHICIRNYIYLSIYFYVNTVYFYSICARDNEHEFDLMDSCILKLHNDCVLMLPYVMQMLTIFCVTERVISDENSWDCGHTVH